MLTRNLFKGVAALVISLGLPLAAADAYTIDAVHSEVGFRIRHLVAKTPGRFTNFNGTILVDNQNLAKSSVNITIEATSINTDNDGRDKHLRGADFFDVQKYPTITFRSVSVQEPEKGHLLVSGDLTMHGVTKRITIPVAMLGTTRGAKGELQAGFEGALRLNRNDFGIKTFPGVLGDDVDITLNIAAASAGK